MRLVEGLLTWHTTLRGHIILISVVDDSRRRKCNLEEKSSFHVLCECDALAGIRQRVLSQAYPDAANVREAEIGILILLHFCQSAGFLRASVK